MTTQSKVKKEKMVYAKDYIKKKITAFGFDRVFTVYDLRGMRHAGEIIGNPYISQILHDFCKKDFIKAVGHANTVGGTKKAYVITYQLRNPDEAPPDGSLLEKVWRW